MNNDMKIKIIDTERFSVLESDDGKTLTVESKIEGIESKTFVGESSNVASDAAAMYIFANFDR